ncbi:hypothetical protein HDV00_008957 [Rhizophlyctis rosea]|nr:hypothetical protein HDV00_008957 [Rhizophlyctis rosea]
MPQTELFRISKNMVRTNRAFTPIPASIEMKRPLGKWSGDSYLFERDFVKREAWEPGCNLGLLVSPEYVVIDVDNKPPAIKSRKNIYSTNTGVMDFQTLIEQNEPIPKTLTVTTPSGGKHYYFALTGKEDGAILKNWTSCMKVNDQLIAVDLRTKGGYVMCPPSLKGTKRYQWDTKDEYKVPMAPLPNWILKNIIDARNKHDQHFESQMFTCEPSANDPINDDDISMFKESPWWQPCFTVTAKPDKHNFYIVKASDAYNCNICERRHEKNSNHPFLVRHHGTLRFVCRPGKGFNCVIEQDFLKTWDSFHSPTKNLIEPMDITNRAVSEMLYGDLKDAVFPTMQQDLWLMFDADIGTWREEFRNVIMRPYVDAYVKRAKELQKICNKLTKIKDDIWCERAALASSLSYSLSMTKKKNDHLSALFELVRDARKENLFNSKKHLLHCTNGVYDLLNNEWRKAKPTDYSMMSTNMEYIPYDEHPEEKRQLLMQYFSDLMLGREELIHFLLKCLCSALDGFINDQQFYVFHGKGANSKSL